MKKLSAGMMPHLSFPDMQVQKMDFFPRKKILNIFVEGAFLDIDNVGLIGSGVLYFSEWESIAIRKYDSNLETWLDMPDAEAEQLGDICEFVFNGVEVCVCGFSKSESDWSEWKIINPRMHAEFEDEYRG